MKNAESKESLQKRMRDVVIELLNVGYDTDTLRQHLIQLNRVFTDISLVRGEETDEAKNNYMALSSGIAISPEFAAMNLRDVLRTVKYLRGIKAAIDATKERLNGERVHLLYAGCGPYGTLVLPLLTLYKPEELKVTLLEIQPKALASVRDICNSMGFAEFIGGIIQTDATQYQHPSDDPIHIITMECMRHALAHEPQVSISRNLTAQLSKDGFLIPEEVRVSFYAVDPEIEFNMKGKGEGKEKVRQYLGEIFVLDKDCHKLNIIDNQDGNAPFIQAATITLPDDLKPLLPLMFFTELKLFGDIMLSYSESGITHPLIVGQQDSFNIGDEMIFKYRLDNNPQFYYEKTTTDPWV